MKKWVAYARVSTDEQAQSGTIQTQHAEIRRYAEREGIAVAECFDDDGVSGVVPIAERPAGARLLAAVHRGAVEAVIVYRLDRLGREEWDVFGTAALLRRFDVRLVSTSESLGDDTPTGRMQFGFSALVAAWERAVIRERTMDGRRRVFGEGGWIGGPVPFGYAICRESEKGLAHLIPHPTRSPIVVRLYERYAEGASLQQLADWLQSLGIPTSRGQARWQANVVRKILANRLYRGEYWMGEECSTVPALVSDELWHRAQERFGRNLHQRSLDRPNPYVLTGYLSCWHCGASYCGALIPNGRGAAYRYYRCNQRKHVTPHCAGRMVPCDAMEARVVQALRDVLDHGLVGLVEVQRARMREIEEGPDRAPMLASQLAAVADQRQIAIGLCTDGVITRDDLAIQVQRLAERRQALEDELAVAKSARIRAQRVEHDLTALWRNLERAGEFLRGERDIEPEGLRALLDTLRLKVAVETVSFTKRRAEFPLHVGTIMGVMNFSSAKVAKPTVIAIAVAA